jgi:hypothetical protein
LFLIFIFLFGLIPVTVFSQSIPVPDAKGFNSSIFDFHFSKADRELTPDNWLYEAKMGIDQAVSAWEMYAFNLYSNPVLFDEAKKNIKSWSDQELEERFSKWLLNRFFGSTKETAINEIISTIAETQKNYLWHLDGDGNIIFDEKTGDPLIIRPGENEVEFSEDLKKWKIEVNNNFNNSAAINTYLCENCHELLHYINEESRESYAELFQNASLLTENAIKSEFENIAARQERIFTTRRTQDILSLRKKSDDAAARLFTEQLIRDTEEICSRGINEISVKIEQAEAGIGDLALLGQEWLAMYKEQFERGLQAWEEAEERFFIRRIEWELESERLFNDGQEIWLSAFNDFANQRSKWEADAKKLFESGEKLFKDISDALEVNITNAKKEFELNMEIRIGAGTSKVKALVDMYLTCASAAVSFKNNLQFWLKKYDESLDKSPDDDDFSEWLIETRASLWEDIQNSYNNAFFIQKNEDFIEEFKQIELENRTNSQQIEFLNILKRMFFLPKKDINKLEKLFEIDEPYNQYLSYINKALDVRDRILQDYSFLLGSGELKDILDPNASSGDFCLDEYQLALIKAKTLVTYWEQKTEIVEAVKDYAEKTNAGRMTAAEGMEAWYSAKAEYDQALVTYQIELDELTEIGADIHAIQINLNELSRQMNNLEEILNRLHSESVALLASSIIVQDNLSLKNVNSQYNLIVELYESLYKTGNEAAYKSQIDFGVKWGIAEASENVTDYFDILINGDNEEYLLSLNELKDEVLNGNVSDLELRIRLAAVYLFSNSENDLLPRTINSGYTGADWYEKVKEITLNQNEKSLLFGNALKNRLIDDYKSSSKELTKNRLIFEIEAFKSLLDGNYQSEIDFDFSMLACSIDLSLAEDYLDILEKYYYCFLSGDEYLAGKIISNNVINNFLNGESYFTGYLSYLNNYYDDYEYCRELLNIYNKYSQFSSFGHNEIVKDIQISFRTILNNFGVASNTFSLPAPDVIYNAILINENDYIIAASKFLQQLDDCFYNAPEWLAYELKNWKSSFINYLTLNCVYSNINTNVTIASIERQRNSLNDSLQIIYSEKVDFEKAESVNELIREYKSKDEILDYQYNLLLYLKEKTETISDFIHWRMYLSDDFLEDYDPITEYAVTRNEGNMLDSLFNLSIFTNCFNDALTLYSNQTNIKADAYSAQYYKNKYLSENKKNEQKIGLLSVMYNELTRYARTYEISLLTGQEAKEELELCKKQIAAWEEEYSEIVQNYMVQAELFLDRGISYDLQYSILDSAHKNTEANRIEFEKQDAIKRWASTSYLDFDFTDSILCKKNLDKSHVILEVLSNLYTDEESRNFQNNEYSILYAAYEESFNAKYLTLNIYNAYNNSLNEVSNKLSSVYYQYQIELQKFGNITFDYSNYTQPDNYSNWEIMDVITVIDGKLAFNTTDWTLSNINSTDVISLNEYFNADASGDIFKNTQYELAVRDLAERMKNYMNDPTQYEQWSLASQYILYQLITNNSDLKFLNEYYAGYGQIDNGGSLSNLYLITDPLYNKKTLNTHAHNVNNTNTFSDDYDPKNIGYELRLANKYDSILENFDDEEISDIIFYTILTLFPNEYNSGFSKTWELKIYEMLYSDVNRYYKKAKKVLDDWWDIRDWLFQEMYNVDKLARNRVDDLIEETKNNIGKWSSRLGNNLTRIGKLKTEIDDLLLNINVLTEEKNDFTWLDIQTTLTSIKGIKEEEINQLKGYLEKMTAEKKIINNTNIADILNSILEWVKEKENVNLSNLETFWYNQQFLQLQNEIIFQQKQEAFMAGLITKAELISAAEAAYGNNAPAWKNYYVNKQNSLINDLSLYLTSNYYYNEEFFRIGYDIINLTTETLGVKYNAEYTAKETEWNQIRHDISEKHREWQEASKAILEAGRIDWDKAINKMYEARKNWEDNFKEEYVRVSDEWNEAYLAGLEDKEIWLAQALEAANNASSESIMSIVGSEGERLSRFVDIREPYGIRNSAPDAENVMNSLLKTAGIVNLYSAFNSYNNIGTVAEVKRGMGSFGLWDSALVKAAASETVKNTNAEIASGQSKIMARNARNTIDNAIKNLNEKVESGNNSFRDNMDNMFLITGAWRRNGKNYSKKVVIGSTLFEPVITENRTITGYNDFVPERINLNTNLNENYLVNLDSIVIIALIDAAQNEIVAIMNDIFGNDPKIIENSTGNKNIKDRKQAPGKFGEHLGYEPAVRSNADMNFNKKEFFYDKGKGEQGRLISEFIYWQMIESAGMAEIAQAAWDKRMWDDSGSIFDAPSLRTVGTIAAGIVAGAVVPGGLGIATVALSVGISTSASFVFNSLDVMAGYKTFDEAAFSYTKDAAMAAVGSIAGGLFSGIAATGTGINGLVAGEKTITQITTKTVLAAGQTAVTSTVNSALSGITYSSKDGFGYSNDIFNSGIDNMWKNVITTAASTFVSTSLTANNMGLDLKKVLGFSNENKLNLGKLNDLAGSLTGEAVGYGLGNDFNLNILNLNLISGEKFQSGLLELHLGREGVKMNIGTGGANVSIDNLYAAGKGLAVWDVNNRINRYTNENNLNIPIALRAQYGFGDKEQVGQLYNILNKVDDLMLSDDVEFSGKTEVIEGKRTIMLGEYHDNMNVYEQLFIATVLGHEAYRDGYGLGDVDVNGQIVTNAVQTLELKNASIGRITMGDKINSEYAGFYETYALLGYESDLLKKAQNSGNFDMFDFYLNAVYNNDEDYAFMKTVTNGVFQNNFSGIQLLDSKKNEVEFEEAFNKFYNNLSEEARNGRSDDEIRAEFVNNRRIQKDNGYIEKDTISLVGCKFMTTQYVVEALTGTILSTLPYNDLLVEKNLHSGNADISTDKYIEILNYFSEGKYKASLKGSKKFDPREIAKLHNSDDIFVALIKVNYGGPDDFHFVLVNAINYIYDNNGKIIDIDSVSVTNPCNSDSGASYKEYKFDKIKRWDIFKITPLTDDFNVAVNKLGAYSFVAPNPRYQQYIPRNF